MVVNKLGGAPPVPGVIPGPSVTPAPGGIQPLPPPGSKPPRDEGVPGKTPPGRPQPPQRLSWLDFVVAFVQEGLSEVHD
ncbi:MAG: hypothetical protein M3N19_09035 [Candidatus Eremiobacteraeota bacterium]|nr:hypothetical protein [Candidatus Eremiobacteraeota bacterium]